MADVSVEFGAKDTGLQQTLKTVQDELTKLNTQVKSGELSFEELQKTMKKVAATERLQSQLENLGNATKEAGQKADKAGGIFDESFKKIAAAFTVGNLAAQGFQKVVDLAFAGAQKVVQGFSDALDLGGRLNELSARTGEAAGKLLVLETAFKNSGLEAGQVGQVINKLQNFMAEAAAGGDKQTAAMDRLGISLSELDSKTPTEQMAIFAKRISEIEDPTQRAAAASDVFGEKLGGKLLPLLTEFSPSLEDARAKVGSLEQVMDENAATFDAAGETIDAINGKFAAFAAGILSETIPAIKDFGTAIEEIDAAGLGKEIGDILAPAIQRLSDATSGAIAVLKQLQESNKKAATDTGAVGETYRNVTASLDGFNKMMHNAFTQFTPMGAAMELLRLRGEKLRTTQDEVATSTDEVSKSTEKAGNEFRSAIPLIGDFNANLEGLAPSFTGVGEQATIIKGDFSEMATLSAQLVGLTNEQSQSLGGVVEQTQLSKQLNEEVLPTVERINQLLEERAAREAERGAKMQEQLQLDLQIAQAKALGNESLLQSLEYQKLFNQYLQQAIDAKMGEDEARAFAKAMADAKTAAGGAADNLEEVKSFVDLIAGSKPEKPVESLREKTKAAREEIEAFGEYIGKDLSGMSFPDIADELGINTIGMDGSEQIDAIMDYIKNQLPDAKVNPVDEESANKSVENVGKSLEEALKKSIDLSVITTKGQSVLSDIKTAVDGIKTEIISRLPIVALA